MASIAEGSDGRGAPIHGVEITSQKIVSPYRLYFKHALGTALPVTFSYSLMESYTNARKQFPFPKHVPPRMVWDNTVKGLKSNALPIIGPMVMFQMTRGWYDQNHPTNNWMDPWPFNAGIAVAALPFLATVALKKPNAASGFALIFCGLDYFWDRWCMTPLTPDRTNAR